MALLAAGLQLKVVESCAGKEAVEMLMLVGT